MFKIIWDEQKVQKDSIYLNYKFFVTLLKKSLTFIPFEYILAE